MADAMVERVRSFNRTVTRSAGALSDRFLAGERPLGEARLLWEIGTEGGEVRALRSRLGLDSGHMSRLLRALEADGLVRVEPGPSDRRIRVARLTRAGLAERVRLDRRSDDLAASILAPLDPRRREQMVDAMRTVERLLTRAEVEIRAVDPESRDARQCIRSYFAELDRRSDSGFDADASAIDPAGLAPPAGAFLVAYLRGEPMGCGGVRHHPGSASEIKWLWVTESVRGLGIGGWMLAELEALASSTGAPAARLDTNRTLVEAVAMYRAAGYAEIPAFNEEPFAHHWFGKPLTG